MTGAACCPAGAYSAATRRGRRHLPARRAAPSRWVCTAPVFLAIGHATCKRRLDPTQTRTGRGGYRAWNTATVERAPPIFHRRRRLMRRAISDLCPDLPTLDLMERGDAAMAEGEALVAGLRILQAQAEARRRERQPPPGADPERPRRSGPTPPDVPLNAPP